MLSTPMLEKMPCGGGWWTIQYPHQEAWIQGGYGEEACVSPSKVIGVGGNGATREPRSTRDMGDGASRDILSCMAGPKPQEEKAKEKEHRVLLVEAILAALDPCATLYTPSQRKDAIETVRTRLLSFVAGSAHTYLGPKKARVLSIWLSGNRIDPKESKILQDFVHFLLEDKASGWIVTPSQHGAWYCEVHGAIKN